MALPMSPVKRLYLNELTMLSRSFFLPIVLVLATFFTGLLFYGMVIAPVPKKASELIYGFFYLQSGILIVLSGVLGVRAICEDFTTRFITVYKLTPISGRQLAWAKFLAMSTVVLVFNGLTVVFPSFIIFQSDVFFSTLVSGVLASLCLSFATLALAMCAASLIPSYVVAAILTATLVGGLLIIWSLASVVSEPLGSILNYMALHHLHFVKLAQGIIDLTDIIYYVSIMIIGLEVAAYALDLKVTEQV